MKALDLNPPVHEEFIDIKFNLDKTANLVPPFNDLEVDLSIL